MRNPILLACAPLLMAACAGLPDPAAPPLGRLILNVPIEVPADAATVRLQFGRAVARNAVNEFEPFCVFELDTVAERPQTVRPETFDIVRIWRSIDTIAGVAPQVRPVRHVRGDDDPPSQIYYKTLFRLRADRQQAVRALSCMSNQMAAGVYPFMRHLEPGEIRGALGALFTLELPTGDAHF